MGLWAARASSAPSFCRPGTLSTAHDDRPVAPLAPGQRWRLARKRDVVLRMMQGEPVEGLSRQLGLPVYQLEAWRQRALAAIDVGLRERDDDPKEHELAEAHRRVEHGERVVAGAAGETRPFGAAEVALMAAATSPSTGQAYGVKRVCTTWGVARSSFYDARRCERMGRAEENGGGAERPAPKPAGRRGPKPAPSDADLLAAIRRDLARSPWTGEGHRKVWARPGAAPVARNLVKLGVALTRKSGCRLTASSARSPPTPRAACCCATTTAARSCPGTSRTS